MDRFSTSIRRRRGKPGPAEPSNTICGARRAGAFVLGLVLFAAVPPSTASILGEDWENFLKERVRFGGFIENAAGLSTSRGDRHFNTSNRFIMNRLTIQPEFNVDLGDRAKFFISWRFVKGPRYSAEAKSRRSCCPVRLRSLDNDFYDEDSPKPWEAVLDLTPRDDLSLRIGRQFVSWGETDGLRLLDVINPQDATFAPPLAPNLFDLDETRIPSWGLRALYTIRPVTNTIFELVVLPGFEEAKQRVDEVLGSNDTADGIVRYGRWSSHPETRMPAAFGGIGRLFADPIGPVPVVIPSITRQLPDAGDSWKIGIRMTHNIGKLGLGLGHVWGFNPQGADMVLKLTGTTLAPDGTTVARLRLVNDRTGIFAGHFNYPLENIAGIPVNTAVRGEIAWYPSQPYNISKFPGPTVLGATLKAGPHPKYPNGVTEKHTLRYSLGFDRSTFIPFLQEDPWRPFRISLQLFQRIIFDHEDGIRPFATADKIQRVTTHLTFRAGTGYFGDTILPDVFLYYDPVGYWAANPALSYAPSWNERVKWTVTAVIYGGRNKFSFPGLLDEKDSVFLKMRYQF